MDTPEVQALMQSAAEEPVQQPHQVPGALQAAAAAQMASGLDGLQALAGQPMPDLSGFPGLLGFNPAQAAAMGNVGQAAATMHLLGANAAGMSARRPGTYSYKASKGGPLVCQVEGCGAALDNLREYHQRYKVCEEHLKMPFIIKDGQQLRFCQQCGRFQPLSDFDGEKRSCRVRLQRHNARRRKRPREGEGNGSADLAAYDAAAASAAAAVEIVKLAYVPPPMPISAQEMQAMQDALQFASATLMHAGQAPPKAAGEEGGSEDGGEGAAGGSDGGGGEGDLGNGNLAPNSMPFVPTVDVMMLLLKGYAAMFHYVLEGATIRPLAPPSELPDQQAAATAGLGGMDPHQMTQLMQAQGFLPAALPFSMPGSEDVR
ncbi:squamosa promoter binding [Chlorella sorokiniana]|uniref:Squamosa promoter binding n=1 Tax=Chlorella sorokiniana TaxID=3076 RepID=A0A2P6U3P2_CHLSO|nr:squamosa promoter binding [Chlorella sorokiniana]|eukprot:PRW60923.1 squamosa promoter binding [Chlorella sorokiniana]